MIKYYTDGTIVPADREHLVRPVRNRNLKQGNISEQPFYERVSDIE